MINKTLWMTGLSGAGKTTLANAVGYRLRLDEVSFCVLDGDVIRKGLNKDLGYSQSDRTENVRRVAEVAKLMNAAGIVVIVAMISPLRSDRKIASKIIGSAYREVYINTAIEDCEIRDSKGLYAKARAGKLQNFTGISAPYEAPDSPNLIIDNCQMSLDEQVYSVMKILYEVDVDC